MCRYVIVLNHLHLLAAVVPKPFTAIHHSDFSSVYLYTAQLVTVTHEQRVVDLLPLILLPLRVRLPRPNLSIVTPPVLRAQKSRAQVEEESQLSSPKYSMLKKHEIFLIKLQKRENYHRGTRGFRGIRELFHSLLSARYLQRLIQCD